MKRKIIAGIAGIILFIIGFTAWKFFGPAVSTSSGEFFYIKTGSTFHTVEQDLLNKKYISNSGWFVLASKVLRYNTIKPGRYKLKKQMSLFSLVKMLRSGGQSQVNLVITKLRTKEDFARKAGAMFECDSLQLIGFLTNLDSLGKYGLDSNTVTAAMMPYTYSINWNTTPGKIFQKLFTAYQIFWTPERKKKAEEHQLTPVQVSTLASIVEEETLNKNDKLNIASVYINRIRIGMPLQADPTVKYALRDFGLRRILTGHLKIVSPYNTYLNRGLPPGPICTPGLETIDAVLDSPKTEYLYFVASSNFDGSSVFTTNLADHSKYARAYQKALNMRLDSSKRNNPK